MPHRNLFIIRIALMTGVFLFAAIAFFGPRLGLAPAVTLGDAAGALRYVLWSFVAIAVVGSTLLKTRVAAVAPAKQPAYLIIGWALGEMAALFGIVLYMGTAGIASMGLGLMAFVFTLVLLPIPAVRR
jgi:hypothetical protein